MQDFTPQVETREIDDTELDNVSGGILGLEAGNIVGTVVGTAQSALPGQVTGLVPAPATGLVGQVQGLTAGL